MAPARQHETVLRSVGARGRLGHWASHYLCGTQSVPHIRRREASRRRPPARSGRAKSSQAQGCIATSILFIASCVRLYSKSARSLLIAWKGEMLRNRAGGCASLACARAFVRLPKQWPRELNRILGLKRSWPSPTAKGHFNTTTAWVWLCAYWTQGFKRQGKSMISAWLAFLYPEQHLMQRSDRGLSCISLIVGPWALVIMDVVQVGANLWQTKHDNGALHWVFVTELNEFYTHSCTRFRYAWSRCRIHDT